MNSLSLINFSIDKHIAHQLPGFLSVHSLESEFLFMNDIALNWLGYQSLDEAFGHSYSDIPCKVSEDADYFMNMDSHVKINQSLKFIGYYCYSDENWRIIAGQKRLLKNEKSEAIGLTSYFNDITNSGFIDISKFLLDSTARYETKRKRKQFCYMLDNHSSNYGLSKKELECLFFYIRGRTAKEIAKILGIGYRTVESYIYSIKNKYGCNKKSQLISYALEIGFLDFIPESLFAT